LKPSLARINPNPANPVKGFRMINVIFSAIGERIKTTRVEIPIYVKSIHILFNF